MSCTWCGQPVASGEGLRALEPAGARMATFCRLEHVVPWAIRGAHWEAAPSELAVPDGVSACAHCAAPLDASPVVLIRERGEARVHDGFCSVDHLLSWAKAGGRYA